MTYLLRLGSGDRTLGSPPRRTALAAEDFDRREIALDLAMELLDVGSGHAPNLGRGRPGRFGRIPLAVEGDPFRAS